MYDDEVFNRDQAAAHLKMSKFTFVRRIKDGTYREHKVGGLRRYYRSELDEDTRKPRITREPRRHSDRKRDEMEAFLFD
jgi:excisionase family DNA binding protein